MALLLQLAKWELWSVILILWIQVHGNKGCFEEERLSLLQFKAFVGSDGSDADHLLPSWIDHESKSDCCKWERVTCNSTTGHVIKLSLDNTRSYDFNHFFYDDENIWFMSISMFHQFKELTSLNLSFNNIGGFVENYEGFERTSSNLSKLQFLDLSYNRFNTSIFSLVASLSSLRTLILCHQNFEMAGSLFPIQELLKLENLEFFDASYNYFNSTLSIDEDYKKLSKLSKLKHLDLSINFLDDEILRLVRMSSSLETLNLSNNYLQWPNFNEEVDKLNNLKVLNLRANGLSGTLPIQKFSTLKSLEILNLKFNEFTGSIPEYTWSSTSLKALSLQGNNFNGSLPQSLCGLKRLEELDLSSNNFRGNLPDCLTNLTSLTFLDLSENQFTGHFPSSWLSSLKSLKFLNLRNNLFEGLFSFNLFSNHSSLEVVDLSYNKIEVVTLYPASVHLAFQLRVIVLQNCSLDNIPKFLFHQSRLKMVDLSHNKIKERFPNWLIENNTGLEYLDLKNNYFAGRILLPIHSTFNITRLDISHNLFSGQLHEIGKNMFPNIISLNLSKNNFQGHFLFSPGCTKCCQLTSLDLSFNNFSGEIPKELISSCTSLRNLKLSHNNFDGWIFNAGFNLTELGNLELNDNRFEGNLSSLITDFSWLEILDLRNNSFHGEIPHWIYNATPLYFLDLSHNSFEGEILCAYLSALYVDLSHNSFYGSLPSCFSQQYSYSSSPEHVNLQDNKLSGSIPDDFLNCSELLTLNLRDNSLSGGIPIQFGIFPNLRVLLLGGNHLNGSISNWLCQLNNITLLDLSKNSFSGSIPYCLYNLSFGIRKGLNITFRIDFRQYNGADGVYSGSLVGIDEYTSSSGDFAEMMYILNFELEIEFVTKHRGNTYKGDILNYMSGLDLSLNKLTGEIPLELGRLSEIHALNLSHNQFVGSIPTSFSNLTQLESLDLSHNRLSGDIPSNLINLNFLEVFSVAYNNLSGRAPDMKWQFGTFDNSSYEGNPFLCVPQVGKSFHSASSSPPIALPHEVEEDGKWYEIDHLVFFTSFSVSFAMFFLGIIAFLYINPYWRRRLFYYAEEFMFSCYYFMYDNILSKLFA